MDLNGVMLLNKFYFKTCTDHIIKSLLPENFEYEDKIRSIKSVFKQT